MGPGRKRECCFFQVAAQFTCSFLQKLSEDRFEFFMYVENVDTEIATNIEIDIDLTDGLLIDWGTLDYIKFLAGNPNSDIINVVGLNSFTWAVGTFNGKI